MYMFFPVPKILEVMLKGILKNLETNKKFEKKIITTTLSEGIIGEYLENIQRKFNDLEIEVTHILKKYIWCFISNNG